ncbi:hypothetical protein HYPSUDRAFT_48610 [Hypholoma sublateritium FD-334 SS-4]|uniref:Uncharacterized protein n=1 Tax=Hypholoma sublateritium (strain FD-334 SS-4) TaxID=945553 RepID=A0A0D2P3T0_HYPSF|nr:hypothetical protein HYPSUDRAFT_48610 [Hypholoma sublateritium FD-334 SS-4]
MSTAPPPPAAVPHGAGPSGPAPACSAGPTASCSPSSRPSRPSRPPTPPRCVRCPSSTPTRCPGAGRRAGGHVPAPVQWTTRKEKAPLPLAPPGDDAPRYQPWRPRARVVRGAPLFGTGCDFGGFDRDEEEQEGDDDDDDDDESAAREYAGALWTSPASVETDLDADEDTASFSSSAASSLRSSRSASGASSTASSMASLSPECARGGALADDAEYADEVMDMYMDERRAPRARPRGRLHVRFSDDDALLSPLSPLSPLPAAGDANHDNVNDTNEIDDDTNSLSPLNAFSPLPKWGALPPLDEYEYPHATDDTDFDLSLRSWLPHADLPDEDELPPPTDPNADICMRSPWMPPAELPPDEDEDDLPPLPGLELHQHHAALPPDEDEDDRPPPAGEGEEEADELPPLPGIELRQHHAELPPDDEEEEEALEVLSSFGYSPAPVGSDQGDEPEFELEAASTSASAPADAHTPVDAHITKSAGLAQRNASRGKALEEEGGAYMHSPSVGEGVCARGTLDLTRAMSGSEREGEREAEEETDTKTETESSIAPEQETQTQTEPRAPPPTSPASSWTPAHGANFAPGGTSASCASCPYSPPPPPGTFITLAEPPAQSPSPRATRRTLPVFTTPPPASPPQPTCITPAPAPAPHLPNQRTTTLPSQPGTDTQAPWALFAPILGLGDGCAGEPPASPSRRRSTDLPALADDVFGLRAVRGVGAGVDVGVGGGVGGEVEVDGEGERPREKEREPFRAAFERTVWDVGGGLGLQLDMDAYFLPSPLDAGDWDPKRDADADADSDAAFARALAALPPDGEARRVLALRQRHRAGSLGVVFSPGGCVDVGAGGVDGPGTAAFGGAGDRERERDREKARELGALLRVKLGLDADASTSAPGAKATDSASPPARCCKPAAVDRLVASMVLARQADASRRRPARARTWSPAPTTQPAVPSGTPQPAARACTALSSASVTASACGEAPPPPGGRAKTPRSPLRQELLPDGEGEEGRGDGEGGGWASLASLVESPGALSPLCLGGGLALP